MTDDTHAITYRDDQGTWYVRPGGLRQRAPELACPTCGKLFISTPTGTRKYCSRACWRATCKRCGKTFAAGSNRATYCSRECKMGSRTCEQCGKEFTPKKNVAGRFCSPTCWYLARHPIGSRIVRRDGYVLVKVEPGTPGARSYGGHHGWMLEHRFVMQQELGRPIKDRETIHHVNGDRHDNRPDNLQLRSGNHGQGVIHECADCGSRNIVTVKLA